MKATIIFFSILIQLLFLSTATASRLLPVSLEQLSTQATLIFVGQVLSNETRQDELSGQVATFTRFKVVELIKGDAAKTHTIKQIGGLLEGSKLRMRVRGVPEFTVGNEYVVFLPEKSALGFSSPLGLHQGSFSITEQDGEKVVRNGRQLLNQAGTRYHDVQIPLATDAQKPGQAYLSDFINTVRSYNIR